MIGCGGLSQIKRRLPGNLSRHGIAAVEAAAHQGGGCDWNKRISHNEISKMRFLRRRSAAGPAT